MPRLVATMLLALAFVNCDAVKADPIEQQLSARLDALLTDPSIGEISFAAGAFLAEFYSRREFRPAWDDPQRVDDVLELIRESEALGLDPEDYHLAALEEDVRRVRATDRPGPQDRINLDLLLTESFVRMIYHRRFGKVNPVDLDGNWNLSRSLDGRDPVAGLQAALDEGNLQSVVAEDYQDVPLFRQLKQVLARYREIERRGGWPAVPPGPTLRLGSEGSRVGTLSLRLAAEGDLKAPGSSRFDETLAAALVRFQRRHRLDADGAVGPRTLEALNVPAEDRVDQIRVNLERLRWIFRDLEEDFLVVNIAGFELWLFRDREIVWETVAQVGTVYRKTPVFKAAMKYLVFNPTWTVPPTILAKDILPEIRKDPGYLERKNMTVIDREGNVVLPDSIDWSSVQAKGFRYAIRQEPGPWNAMGRVKFMFPNPYFVFLHDTPARDLFDRPERAFSSGCIRVRHPLELAERLLDDAETWNRAAIDRLIESREPTNVVLDEPLTVMLLYWTVDIDRATGEIHFLKDLYGRDREVLAALDEEFAFHELQDAPGWAP